MPAASYRITARPTSRHQGDSLAMGLEPSGPKHRRLAWWTYPHAPLPPAGVLSARRKATFTWLTDDRAREGQLCRGRAPQSTALH